MQIRKFITKLQTPEKKTDPDLDKEMLLRAVKLGITVEKEIYDTIKDDAGRKSKVQAILGIFISLPTYRTQLLSGELKAAELVRMNKEDFISADKKKKLAEAAEAKMQAQRTDYHRAEAKKGVIPDGFFTCKRCKSKKTTFYQQQTRGADEPMTNFIQCLECNYNMKS